MASKLAIETEMIRSILIMASMIEARDPYTGGHTWRVSQYANRLAGAVGFGPEGVFMVTLGGLIHDLGKVGISDQILLKNDRLTETEYEIMKKHPLIGNELVEHHPYYAILRDAVLNHHERVDGKGYPIKQDRHDMTPVARIMAIADAFDAMTSTRAYRKGMPLEKALRILEEEKDKQFDGKMVDIFVKMALKGELDHILGHSAEEKLLLECPGCGPVIAIKANHTDGDHINCPVCHGAYKIHAQASSFELEFTGEIKRVYVPEVDIETVDHFMQFIPKEIDYADYVNPNYKLKQAQVFSMSTRTD